MSEMSAKNIFAKFTEVASKLIVDFKNIDYYSKPNQEEKINNIIYKQDLYNKNDIEKVINYMKQELSAINENINSETDDNNIGGISSKFSSIEYSYDRFFLKCNKQYKNGTLSQNLYNLVKEHRGLIYTKACNFKAVKLHLKKEKFVQEEISKFQTLTGKEKSLRVFLLVIAFPIYAPIFILVKAIRKFIYCLTMGLEVVGLIFYRVISKDKKWGDCKDEWAKTCETGELDGIKINGEEVCKRIRWYETSRWLFWRRVFFPINLAVFLVIGVVLAVFKLIKSIFKIFVVVYRIIKDILSDNPCAYIFKKEGLFMYNESDFLSLSFSYTTSTHELQYVHLQPIAVAENKHIKIKNKFIDMTCPRIPCYNFAEKPKSAWEHCKCLTGFKNIKDAELWDQYKHWESKYRESDLFASSSEIS